MSWNAKTLAQHLRKSCLSVYDERKDLKPGERVYEVSSVFRGGPVSGKGEPEGAYHFTISEDEMVNPERVETVWQCTVYVTPNLDVLVDDCKDLRGKVPHDVIRHVFSCALDAEP